MPHPTTQSAITAGPQYWRSLAQLADAPETREMISREFPGYDADTIATRSRRSFLKLMGASLALAGLTLSGCRRVPDSKLAPYAAGPRDRIPGIPEQYATAIELGGVAAGLLVTSYDGRPIKIEGNPSHPFAWTVKEKIGAADAFAQASVLELYDPQRSRTVIDRTAAGRATPSTWEAASAGIERHFAGLRGKGEGFAILSEPVSGPSAQDMRHRLLAAYPQAKWYEYEPLTRDAELKGARIAYGQAIRPVLHLEKASVVVLLDADLLGSHPARVRYAADWSARRRTADDRHDRRMSRVYLAESRFSVTGTVADVRLGIHPGRIYPIARALASKLGVAGVSGEEQLSEPESKFVERAAADLRKAGAAGVVSTGPSASPHAHALAFAINQQIGAVGQTVTLHEDPAAADRPTHLKAIADLAADIRAGRVTTLLVLGGNPAYDAPVDLDFAAALAKVPMSIRLGLYDDETSAACKWHLPRAQYLESWGDARALDGTPGIVQPLIEPLFGGRSVIEVLALVAGDNVTAGDQIVRRTWQGLIGEKGNFDLEYRRAMERGLLPGSGYAAVTPALKSVAYPLAPATPPGLWLRFEPDSRVYDGRFANNGWLQETPDPLTKLVWDNAALISKKDADALGVTTGDVVRIDTGGRSLEVAAYVLPGQPVGVIGLSLGYGRTAAGSIGNGLGFNAYTLRTRASPYAAAGVTVAKTGRTYALAMTQDHHIIDHLGAEGRDERVGERNRSGEIIHETTFAEYAANPRALRPRTVSLEQLFEPPHQFNDPHAWGMAVDLNACIGCNACAVACQSENNIPVVGKTEVMNHREMNWIRIDRYFKGDAADPEVEVVHQPVMCQHCENAPCEQVCPATATVHDSEGLNTMVYNRCIGTRYCSNNCSYKVRRFNYFDFHSKDPRQQVAMPWPGIPDTQQNEQIDRIKRMVFNPEVTVRMRGVMEKCTYCVQRIHSVTTSKRAAGQGVQDGDILTACQQACPTQAITFGNLNDREAKVTQLHQNDRSYKLLDELNTRPRTAYLARLRNV